MPDTSWNPARDKQKRRLKKCLGPLAYVIYRGQNNEGREWQLGPDNLSLDDLEDDETVMVYLLFAPDSTRLARATAFLSDDVRKGRFPMTHSWGSPERENKCIVVTEEEVKGRDGERIKGMWAEREKYPEALFRESISIDQLCTDIVEKFRDKLGSNLAH